jgi:hypothetical protein
MYARGVVVEIAGLCTKVLQAHGLKRNTAFVNWLAKDKPKQQLSILETRFSPWIIWIILRICIWNETSILLPGL